MTWCCTEPYAACSVALTLLQVALRAAGCANTANSGEAYLQPEGTFTLLYGFSGAPVVRL